MASRRFADESLAGGARGARNVVEQNTALSRVGGDLAANTLGAATSEGLAGKAVNDLLGQQVNDLAGWESTAYQNAEHIAAGKRVQINASTFNGFKRSFAPAYNLLKRESELTPLMGGKAKALQVLDRLMQVDTAVPMKLMDAERALGDLKEFGRLFKRGQADLPGARTTEQWALEPATRNLQAVIDNEAKKASPTLLQQLQHGRTATAQKYTKLDVLDSLNAGDVKTFDQLMARKDTNFEALQKVLKEVPKAGKELARGYLEDILKMGEKEGPLAHADAMASQWQRLGPNTRQAVYGAQAADIDQFFSLMRSMAKNANPSRTAVTLHQVGEVSSLMASGGVGLATGNFLPALGAAGYTLSWGGIAKILRTPGGAKLLTEGLRIPIGAKAAGAAFAGRLSKMAAESGAELVPLPLGGPPQNENR